MQICALDSENNLIFASHASKHKNYTCLECGQHIRLRGGLHRQFHYYHIQPNRSCKQHAKGMIHLMLQLTLQSLLPVGDVELEHRFKTIGRIADVVWLSESIVYEIQCSPISAEEVESRNQSYASIGFQVVWVFHDQRYNQRKLTSAEYALLLSPHYFTDMTAKGDGIIYDQFAVIHRGIRLLRLPRLPIELTRPLKLNPQQRMFFVEQKLPKGLLDRAREWPLGFFGDSIDRLLRKSEHDKNDLDHLFAEELEKLCQRIQDPEKSILQIMLMPFRRWVVFPYICIFRLLLERACR